jgi:hypothetical protein
LHSLVANHSGSGLPAAVALGQKGGKARASDVREAMQGNCEKGHLPMGQMKEVAKRSLGMSAHWLMRVSLFLTRTMLSIPPHREGQSKRVRNHYDHG